MSFPVHRPRRLRRSEALRRMVRETTLEPTDFIYPLFVKEGRGERVPIASMPGIFNFSVDTAVEEAKTARDLGIPALILFGIPARKDAQGTEAYAADGIVQRALRTIKDAVPELQLIADVCLCEYT
ncbi:MAG: porphobilinogen synthase, partial [Myxococcaceae bacterium]